MIVSINLHFVKFLLNEHGMVWYNTILYSPNKMVKQKKVLRALYNRPAGLLLFILQKNFLGGGGFVPKLPAYYYPCRSKNNIAFFISCFALFPLCLLNIRLEQFGAGNEYKRMAGIAAIFGRFARMKYFFMCVHCKANSDQWTVLIIS